MLRRLVTPMTAALLSGGLLFPSIRAEDSNNHTSTTAVHPFTHFAYIPVGADLGTIRFEKVTMVKVPAGFQYTTDPDYCQELAFRDPGGSIACPSAQSEAPVPAYEATYSFTGQPLASDEYGGRNFTFSVYLQPGELAPDVQKALAGGKLSRSDAAAYFAVNTYREAVRRVAIDNQQSHFCDGNFVDGMWAHTDPGCNDNVVYAAVTVPSGYITVKVEPVSKFPSDRNGLK
jgi:hypothetical protein